ncbi:MAG TPA: hypothetical protein VFW63_07750 [Acidimicrobiales bacterium]|nr:hypothetical protein [Acidimicrobiales bacterium]
MDRPTRFEHKRYLGDKRSQLAYDLDNADDAVEAAVDDLVAAEAFTCFGPDTLAEARNRGYRLAPASHRARVRAGVDETGDLG